MNEAEQELYEALVAICQTSGFLLLEELPTDLPDQPFVYLGDSKELPKPTKSAILGEIELIMHVYGALSERQQISTIKGTILRRATSNLKRTAHFNWGIKHQEVKAQMVKDTKQMKNNLACCTTITHAILLGGIINGRSYARKRPYFISSSLG